MNQAGWRASSRYPHARASDRLYASLRRWPAGRHDIAAVLFWAFTALFLLTAALGVWVAYDRGPALRKFALISGGVGVAAALPLAARLAGGRVVRRVTGLWVALIIGLALFGLVAGAEDSDAAAGAIAIVVPLAAAGLHDLRQRLRREVPSIAATGLATALGLVALAGSREGAAWTALAGAALFAGWAMSALTSPPRRSLAVASGGVLLSGGLAAALGSLVSLRVVPGAALRVLPAHVAGRLEFWHDAMAVVQDYVFTGSGLASTGMVLSSYVWQLHVPFTEHVHHLFLQVAIEQGVLGCLALMGMLATSGWAIARRLAGRHAMRHPRSVAAGSSFVALVLYGLAESDLYCSPLVPFLFLPFGFTWMLEVADRRDVRNGSIPRTKLVFGGAVVMLFAVGVFVSFRWSAQWQANLAAVAQTRAELSVYRWPQWGIQDTLRRDRVVDLAPAIAGYQAALMRDPSNVTALRRLGQIELSRGDYESATQHLTRAYAQAPDQRATRQMLGELYAVGGELDAAVRMWITTGNEHGQLDARAWWYGHLGATGAEQRVRQVMAGILREP